MSAPKHTPGPWHWWGYYLCPVEASQSKVIANILNQDGSSAYRDCSLEDMEAELAGNLCLIAAAPELLEALKAVFELATIQHLEQHDVWADVLLPVYDVIAKAEGRS